MPNTADSSLAEFDADAALAAIEDVAGDGLRVCAEYDAKEFNVLFLSEWLVETLGGTEGFESVADHFHSYVHIDFVARTLFTELSPTAGTANAYATRLDNALFVRYLVADEGLFLSFDPDTDLTAVLDTLDGVLDGDT